MLRTFSHTLSSHRSQRPSLGSFGAIVGSGLGRLYRVSVDRFTVENHPAIDCRKPAMVGAIDSAIESTISRQDWGGEGRPNPRTNLKTYRQCGARRRKAC